MRVALCVCVCVCVIVCAKQWEKDRHTKRKRWVWRKTVISREDRGRREMRHTEKYEPMDCIVCVLSGIILPPSVCAQNNIFCQSAVECVMRPSVPHPLNNQHSHKLNRHTASKRHVELWYEFIVWQYKLDLGEFIDFPRETSWQKAQKGRRSHHGGKCVKTKQELIRFSFFFYTYFRLICLEMWSFVMNSCQHNNPAVTFHC